MCAKDDDVCCKMCYMHVICAVKTGVIMQQWSMCVGGGTAIFSHTNLSLQPK